MRSEEQGELSLARPPAKTAVPMELAAKAEERQRYLEGLLAGRAVA